MERSRWRIRVVVLCAALLMMALGLRSASAQTFRGSIFGTVTDTSGAAIYDGSVTAHNVDTGVDRITNNTRDGG